MTPVSARREGDVRQVEKGNEAATAGIDEKEGIITTEYECFCEGMNESGVSVNAAPKAAATVATGSGRSRKRALLTGFLAFAIGISILNTLWNKVEERIELANRDIVTKTADLGKRIEAALASVKSMEAEFASLKQISESNTNDVASLKMSVGSYSDQTQRLELQAKRHADYLKRELRGKQMELRELAELVRFQEMLLGETKTGDTHEVAASSSPNAERVPQAGGKIGTPDSATKSN
jgi:hypothetical protein